MKRQRTCSFALLLLLAGLQCGPAIGAQATDSERVGAQLEALTTRLNDLDSWLNEAQEKRLRLQKALRDADRAVARAAAAVASSDAALAETRRDLARLDAEGEALRARQALQAGRIGDHLAAAYRLGGQDRFKLLLDQGSPETVARMQVYYRYLIEARLAALESYRQATAAVARNTEALLSRQAAERQQRESLVTRQQHLQQSRGQQRSLVESLARDVEDRKNRRSALLRDQQRLQTLFAELRRQSSTLSGTGFAERRGKLPWPLDGAVVKRFGAPRAEGRMKWQGVLLRADAGSPVRAVFRGQVVFADWLRGFGLLTILDHGDGYMSLYGHADRLAKRPGDLVEAGEVIAHAGQSGGTDATGLYFEIRQGGKATNPLRWVAGRR